MPLRDAAGEFFYALRHLCAEVGVQGADRSPEAGSIGDDVEGGSGPDLPHRQYRGLDGVDLPGDYGLQRRYDLRGDGYGVGGEVGHRPVSSRGLYLHLEGVGGGHDGTGLCRHLPEREPRPQVQREDGGNVVGDALVDHDLAPASTLLGGLEEELYGAVEPVSHPRKRVRRADEHAGVPVVAAGVHLAFGLRGERQTSILQDRKRVHVRPKRHGRPVAFALQRGDDTVLRNPGLYVQGQTVEGREDLLGGLLGIETELGLAVDVAPERDDLLSTILLNLLAATLRTRGRRSSLVPSLLELPEQAQFTGGAGEA